MHQRLVDFIGGFPQGVSAGEIERHFDISRTTLNRWLKEALRAGTVTVTGKGNNLAEARRFWKKWSPNFMPEKNSPVMLFAFISVHSRLIFQFCMAVTDR